MPKKINLEAIAQRTGIKSSKIKEILWLLYQKGKIRNNEFVREIGLPKSATRMLLKNLQLLLEKPSQFVILNKEGKNFVEGKIGSLNKKLSLYEEQEKFKDQLFNLLKRYQPKRPKPKRNLDQFQAVLETVVKRALLIQARGDLEGNEILVLGDYDLTGLALALLGGARKIVVVDIDRQLLRLIEQIAQKEKLKVKCFYYDAKEPLPPALRKSFDLVFSDPPYTPNGFKLFLSRAIEAMKTNEGVLYFCYGYSSRSPERGLEVQRIMDKTGLLIEEKLSDFNVYFGAESIGSHSSLYVLRMTPKTQALIKDRFKGPIYTGQKRR